MVIMKNCYFYSLINVNNFNALMANIFAIYVCLLCDLYLLSAMMLLLELLNAVWLLQTYMYMYGRTDALCLIILGLLMLKWFILLLFMLYVICFLFQRNSV